MTWTHTQVWEIWGIVMLAYIAGCAVGTAITRRTYRN